MSRTRVTIPEYPDVNIRSGPAGVSSDLLPCPFCGSPAAFESGPAGHSVSSQSGVWHVTCTDSADECPIGGLRTETRGYARKVEAARAWNTRS